jgi:hypothetical protein
LKQNVWFWTASLLRSFGQAKLGESALKEVLQTYLLQQPPDFELAVLPGVERVVRQLAECASTPAARVLAAQLSVRALLDRSGLHSSSFASVEDGIALPKHLGLLAKALHRNSQHSSCIKVVDLTLQLLYEPLRRQDERSGRSAAGKKHQCGDPQINAVYDVLMHCGSSYV